MIPLKKIAKELGRNINRNSPSILTGIGVAGFFTSIVMAVSATPKALSLIDKEVYFLYEEEAGKSMKYGDWLESKGNGTDIHGRLALLTLQEKAQISWQCYVPAAGMALISATSVILANRISLRRNAALASLYAIAESGLRDYQAKVVEQVGTNKEAKIRGEVAQQKLSDHPIDDGQILIKDGGKMLCYDTLSGRYFESDIETLRQIQNEFNARLLNEMTLTVNELYYDMGLGGVEFGASSGWVVEKGLMEFEFNAKIASNGQPCIVVGHTVRPQYLYF